jgi:CHASE2 domain-containing sensor protein
MKKDLNKTQLLKESLVITFLIMLATLGLQFFPLNFEVAKTIKEEFSDFDVYDIIYSGDANGNHTRDSNIIIFQVATSREEIAHQLELLQKFKPAVIGVDLTFIGHSDNLQADSLLEQQLLMPNVVTGNRIEIDSNNNVQKLTPNFFDGSNVDHSGYFNFWGDEISVVRYYPPFLEINNRWQYAFTSRIAEKYNGSAFSLLKKKSAKFQVINYRGNVESYTSFVDGRYDTTQLGEIIKDKIVLLGVLHKHFPLVLEDLHFTPLNEKINGKSFPDMYGVVIQANILSMILSGSYITSVARIWSFAIAVLLTFLLVHFQLNLHYKDKRPSDLWFFLMQIIIIFILVYIFLAIYKYMHYKIFVFPIIMPIVLCIEVIEIYKFLISRFFRKSKYKSIYINHK